MTGAARSFFQEVDRKSTYKPIFRHLKTMSITPQYSAYILQKIISVLFY
jgi:hypothetical protein